MRKYVFYPAARISIVYLVIAGLWIFLSDHALSLVASDPQLLTDLQSIKGFLFVAVMAVLLYSERLSGELANRRTGDALRLAEHKYRSIFETAPVGIFQVTPDGQTTDANPAFAQMLGYDTPQELIDHFNTNPEEHRADNLSALLRAGKGTLAYEHQYRCKQGRIIDAHLNVRIVQSDHGRPAYLEGFVEDITERKAAEQKLKQMADIVTSSQDAIYAVDMNNIITSWNPAASVIYGYAQQEAEGKDAAMLIPPDQDEKRINMRDRIHEGTGFSQSEIVHMRKDGTSIDVSLTASPIHDSSGTVIGISIISRDVTEHKRMTQRLQEQQAALRQYAHRLVQSQEEERKRLSRELHDETLQDLVALAQRAELSRTAIERNPAVALRRLDELQSVAKTMVIELRRLSNDLRPLILEDLGIAAALSYLCDELGRQMPGCEVHCEIAGDERRLEPDIEVTVFRIVQQALNNVRLHAPETTHVEVVLTFTDTHIRATVTDDGPGFTPMASQELLRQGHLGLAGMRERASLLGGDVDIVSSPRSGTTVALCLPLTYDPIYT